MVIFARSKKAFSIIELLMSMFVFSIFVFMVGDMVVTAYRAKGRTEEKVESRRQVTIMYSEIHRQLRTRKLSCFPLDGTSSSPISPISSAPLFIEYYRPDGQLNKVNYYFDPNLEAVVRSEIAPPSTSPQAKIIVRHAKSFSVTWDSTQKLSTISVRVSTINEPISTQIYYYLPAFKPLELAIRGGNNE